ncbi:MAG: homoserine O-succinyltransferase, partial [Bacteroidales bacterium]|nr:homoserine O-succinyltransferase [Bacteroidales bacterium]
MLLNIPHNFPALKLLAKEQFSISDLVLSKKEAKPHLKVAVLNLMPLKIDTEADMLRIMSNSPLYIHLDFIYLESHTPKNTTMEHIQEFYKPFSAIKNDKYDGFIVTGAPVELFPFEEVGYWTELEGLFNWARQSVTSTLYICWGAQAA